MKHKKTDKYYWRLFCTGLSFFNFGLGGLVFRFICIPVLYLLPIGAERRKKLSRLCMHKALALFVWQMRVLGVLSYEVSGLEKIKPGQLLIANHPSLIDVVFLLALIENVNCIVNRRLFYNPFTASALRGAAFIPNCESMQLVEACKRSLQNGDILIIFPEGTRTPINQMPKFQRGAANIALATGATIIPVKITCSQSTLTKGEKWYHIPPKRPHWKISVGEAIEPSLVERTPRAARELTKQLYQYFFKENMKCH